MSRSLTPVRRQAGFSLIEILVAIVILAIGLLGVLGMQTRAAVVEFESYQRGQALSIARDMQARLLSARGLVSGYRDNRLSSTDGSVYVGEGQGALGLLDADGNCPAATAGDPLSEAQRQMCEWTLALRGAAQREGADRVGAMLGARGCLVRVEPPQLNAMADFYVVVVWEGSTPRAEPPADTPAARCAADVDFGAGLRRGLSVRVLVPDLRKGA